MTPAARSHVTGHAARLVVSGGWTRLLLIVSGLGAAVTLSAAGLFVEEPALRIGPTMASGDILRLAYVSLLVVGLAYAAYHYARKHHTRLDELALLVLLTCGVNLVVQLTGGSRSYWQGLYLVLGGLASVAFARRLVFVLVALVLFLQAANWLVQEESSWVDPTRLALLFLLAVFGYNYMERAERERAERAEDRLLRLNTDLKQLAGPYEPESLSPLSEEGHRVGQAEQLHRLEQHLSPLIELARRATGSNRAALLQAAEGKGSFWVKLATVDGASVSKDQFPLKGSFLSEVLKSERPVALGGDATSIRLPWWLSQESARSVLAVPIRIWDEAPWVLVLDHDAPEHFDSSRREMACAIAEQMSEAQALFRRQAKQQVEEFELKGLLGASEKLSSAARVGDLLRHVVDYAREVAGFDTCAVCLREENEESFQVMVAEGYRKELLGKRFALESPTWAGWVLRARDEPLAIRMERRSGMPILDPKERPSGGSSFLAVPLRAQNRVSGALFLTRNDAAFTARELRLLRIYCNQAAVAIENAVVYEKVENLAATDALTGLFNRRYLEGALARELARADRTSSTFALVILDIDHFKRFNDTYGHAMGDLVLKRVAETLSSVLRKADVLARFGGEEFVVLLPQVSPKGALESAERIRTSVAGTPLHPGGPRRRVTVSLGLAMFPEDADSGKGLLEAADEALYAAKRNGRNRVCRNRDVKEEARPR